MATFKSDEVTAAEASVGEKYQNIDHLKTSQFTYNTAGTEEAADVIELVELPVGSEIVGYAFTNEDFGTSTGDLGTTSGGQELAAGLALGTAGNVSDFFAPVALGSTGKVYLEILTATADADKDINGFIYYID
tara:strand:- start:43 stop:441 length:399 start_codon:yes stop_codon:yes gene_type:complete